jgi:ubiquinone/menaquinone biosynthesis C-methylase UbiE
MAASEAEATSREAARETARVRAVYGARLGRSGHAPNYSLADEAYLFAIQGRQRAIVRRLRGAGLWPPADMDILEVGCGAGGVLLEMLGYGADPRRLHGAELLVERVAAAHERLPHLPVTCASGAYLPYPDHSFDLILQFTVFSSILDRTICYTVAKEMIRVVKTGGAILWYDFWINPLNKQTRGIRPREIRAYFPRCSLSFERITLGPPIARRLVPFSWPAARLLEQLRLFNTHYLAMIRPNE